MCCRSLLEDVIWVWNDSWCLRLECRNNQATSSLEVYGPLVPLVLLENGFRTHREGNGSYAKGMEHGNTVIRKYAASKVDIAVTFNKNISAQ